MLDINQIKCTRYDFMFVMNSVRLLEFLISRGIIFHIFGARYINDFKP